MYIMVINSLPYNQSSKDFRWLMLAKLWIVLRFVPGFSSIKEKFET